MRSLPRCAKIWPWNCAGRSPADEVSEGQEIMVKCIGIDPKNGKIKLSRKALLAEAGAEK